MALVETAGYRPLSDKNGDWHGYKHFAKEKQLLRENDKRWTTSHNRAYLALCHRHSVQIQPYGWTSDTLETLYAIASKRQGKAYAPPKM